MNPRRAEPDHSGGHVIRAAWVRLTAVLAIVALALLHLVILPLAIAGQEFWGSLCEAVVEGWSELARDWRAFVRTIKLGRR